MKNISDTYYRGEVGMGQRIFGYARVSSKEQNLDRQIVRLKQHVSAENILTDKASGKDLERPAYQALKGTLGLRVGYILVITSLDRLSRSKADLQEELQMANTSFYQMVKQYESDRIPKGG